MLIKCLLSAIFAGLLVFAVMYGQRLAQQSLQERNTAVVKRFLNEVVSGGNTAILDELWTPDMYWYNNGSEVRGLETFRKQLNDVLGKSFSNMKKTPFIVLPLRYALAPKNDDYIKKNLRVVL